MNVRKFELKASNRERTQEILGDVIAHTQPWTLGSPTRAHLRTT
jgi:hypothetical protein